MNIHKILVPTDFSENAEHALTYATGIAEAAGAEVHLLHVPVLPTYLLMDLSYSPGPEVVTRIHEEAEEAVGKHAETVRAAGVTCVERVRSGPVHEVIRDYAKKESVDLVILGTHGRTGVSKLLYGSVTERVVKTTHTPILVVPPDGAPLPSTIVIAYDFSTPAKRAADLARALHGLFHGAIHLTHTYLDVWAEYTDRGAVTGDAAETRRTALRQGLQGMLEDDARELFSIDAQSVQAHLVAGDATDGILGIANDVGATLICAGTTGKSGVERVLLGSVARRLLHDSHVPVLLAHDDV
ncbi:MAG: universal stress protein [Polyangiales bacterium]